MNSSSEVEFKESFLDVFVPKHFLRCSRHFVIGIYKCNSTSLQINCVMAVFCEEIICGWSETNCSNILRLVNELKERLVIKKNFNVECIGLILDVKEHNQLWKYKEVLSAVSSNIRCIFKRDSRDVLDVIYFQFRDVDLTHKCQTRIIIYDSDIIRSLHVDQTTIDRAYSSHSDMDGVTFLLIKLSEINDNVTSHIDRESSKNMFLFLETKSKRFCFVQFFFTTFIRLTYIVQTAINVVHQTRLPTYFFKKINLHTNIGRQMSRRLDHISYLSQVLGQKKDFSLRTRNLIYAVLLDIIAGWLSTYLILHYVQLSLLLENVVTYADEVVNKLQNLLYWLMGVPAGLKLNYPLSAALGHFFLYHIYLWKIYMAIIKPVFTFILESLFILGLLGLTFLLSLLSDLISLATIHIYCFYGYAARLYGFQILSLASLWRLFRGMKWNPLRQRVDSFSYDVSQLFIGTLIFTVLLFMLPTVLVYYFVFSLVVRGKSSMHQPD